MSEVYVEDNRDISSRKLFSIEQIALASFFGAPMSGCLLMAQNYRALGKAESAWRPIVLGVAGTIVVMLLALFLPDGFPNYVLPAASCFGIFFYTKQHQGDALIHHFKDGGQKGSWWVVIGVSIACTVVLLILLFAIVITFDILPPEDGLSDPVAMFYESLLT